MKCLDYWRGYCYLQKQDPDQAMVAFVSALSSDKFYFKARDGIAQIDITNGKFQDAVEEYRQALAGNPANAEAWEAFARALLLWNLHRSPAERNWNEVDRVLQQAETNIPADSQIQLLRAEMWLAQGREDMALKIIDDLHADVARANLAAQRGDVDQARQVLSAAKDKLGDQAPIRLAQARILLREQGLRAGAEIEKLGDGVDAFSPNEKAYLWNGLVESLAEIREYERAKELCRKIARLEPKNATIRYRLLELALVTHDPRDPAASLAELDRVLEEIDAIAGQGPLWLYGKAVRLKLEAGHDHPELLDAAMKYAAQALAQRVSWSRPEVLMGEICRERGLDEEALQHYMRALNDGDRDLEFICLLLQMLDERQRYQEADRVIQRLDSSQTPLTPEIDRQVAEILVKSGEFDRALESANRAYDADSGDYREHVRHGQVLRLLARRAQQEGHQVELPRIAEEAEKALRRACQIAPNAPECRVELVRLLAATNQPQKARFAASDAEEMIGLATRPLAMGYIYEALGESEKAGQSYAEAVQRRPDLPQAALLLADFYVRHNDFQLRRRTDRAVLQQ